MHKQLGNGKMNKGKYEYSQKVQFAPYLSFLRKQESSNFCLLWTPAFAGVTQFLTFYESIKYEVKNE